LAVWSATVSDVRRILVFKEYLVENLVKNGGFETGDLTDWNVQGSVGGVYCNGAFEGSCFLTVGANRYSGFVYQRLPISDFKIFRFACRFYDTYSPQDQEGYFGFLDVDTWTFSRDFSMFVHGRVNNRFRITFEDKEVYIPAILTADGTYDSGWHIITGILKEGNIFDIYLDGEWITKVETTRYPGVYVGATGHTTSIISGSFGFDDIVVG